MWRFISSALFSVIMITLTVIFALLTLIMWPLPFLLRSRALRLYAWLNMQILKYLCGITYQITGQENIPPGAVIIFSKHQSTWETFALQTIFNKVSFVFKQELLWVPFFGWGLATMKPISIKRGSGKQAVAQMVRNGTKRLKEGVTVAIFPEGTRTSATGPGKYRVGGAVLAAESGFPVVPVAHNAGQFWRRKGFLKEPGRITVRIGPAIQTRGKTPEVILDESKKWIEGQMVEISRPGYGQ